jgi:hypothetical protein
VGEAVVTVAASVVDGTALWARTTPWWTTWCALRSMELNRPVAARGAAITVAGSGALKKPGAA